MDDAAQNSVSFFSGLYVRSFRIYYHIRWPLIVWVVRTLIPFKLRTHLLLRFYNLEARLSTRSLQKPAQKFLESSIGVKRGVTKIANYRLLAELDEKHGEILYCRSDFPPHALKQRPYWGKPPAPIARRHLDLLPHMVCRIDEGVIEGDCLGVFVGDVFYSPLLSHVAPDVFACYWKHNLRAIGRLYAFDVMRKSRHVEVENVIFLASCQSYGDNYFHFQVDVLPALLNCLKAIEQSELEKYSVIVPASLPQNIRAFLDIFLTHYSLSTIHLTENTAIRAKNILLASYTSRMPDVIALDRIGTFHVAPDSIRELREILSEHIRPPALTIGTEDRINVLYLSRRKLGKKGVRHITNAAEIVEMIAGMGGTVIQPENLTLEEQMNYMARADCVVCDGGAAVANAVFCRAHTPFIVLIHDKGLPHVFMSYADGVYVDIAFVFGKAVEKTFSEPVHNDCEIPLDLLRSAIDYKQDKNGRTRTSSRVGPHGWL